MSKSSDRRLVLIHRRTRLQEIVERFNTWSQAKFYMKQAGIDVIDFKIEHEVQIEQMAIVERIMRKFGRFQRLDRELLPSYKFETDDIVVTVGQDGLVANTLKYLSGQPVIGVNPDPDRWDGKLLCFEVSNLSQALKKVLAAEHDRSAITFAEVVTNLGQSLLAVNDLFIGPNSHTSARYRLHWNGTEEAQSSSGIIISTGFGSTGWLSSIIAGAIGVSNIGTHPLEHGFSWDARELYFTVREPFPSKSTSTENIFGKILDSENLKLESMMPDSGIIFSDGLISDSIPFNAGCIAEVGVSKTVGQLVTT